MASPSFFSVGVFDAVDVIFFVKFKKPMLEYEASLITAEWKEMQENCILDH